MTIANVGRRLMKQAKALALGLSFSLWAPIALAQTVTYFHNDASGTPLVATDSAGNVVWKENYRPYGDKLNNQPASSRNKIGFAGRPYDGNTGLSYMGARYYDPVIGRFSGIDAAAPDPENIHSLNRYAYANNNPYRYVDPDGNTPLDVAFLVWDLGKLGFAVYTGNPAAIAEAGVDVGLSLVGVVSPVPGTGQAIKAARAAKQGIGALKTVDHVADTGKAAKGIEKAAHANKIDNRPATLYEKYDKDGKFLKHGVTKYEDPTRRYTAKQRNGGTVVRTDRGPRSEMIKKERDLVERNPGPENREPWRGTRMDK